MAMAVTLPMVANTTNTASSPLLPSAPDTQKAAQTVKAGDVQILRINPTLVEIVFANQQRVAVDFYGESVFRIFEDHNDGVMRAPEAKPEASILVDNPRTALNHKQVKVEENDNSIILLPPRHRSSSTRLPSSSGSSTWKTERPWQSKALRHSLPPKR